MRSLFSVIRYRFLLFAGIFPYILGSVVAFHYRDTFELFRFLVGFLGITLVLVGVEVLNEYFDYKLCGDRIFLTERRPAIPKHYLPIGVLAFTFAFVIALYLTLKIGLPIMIFPIIGAISAIFYLAPPVSFSYRGLGEIIIFLNYGPFMTLGSYYLQTQRIDLIAVLSSLLPGFLVLALAIINGIPDYHSDKLVGKKNIVVRLGKKKAVNLYIIMMCLSFFILTVFIINQFSILLLLAFLSLPLVIRTFLIARKHYETPKCFIPAVRGTTILYTVIMSLFIISFL